MSPGEEAVEDDVREGVHNIPTGVEDVREGVHNIPPGVELGYSVREGVALGVPGVPVDNVVEAVGLRGLVWKLLLLNLG